ncbi:Uncharacterised protein [Staphylococcus xylosus]|nr:Uncharacterised protein [Staphylococcus xylosus]
MENQTNDLYILYYEINKKNPKLYCSKEISDSQSGKDN